MNVKLRKSPKPSKEAKAPPPALDYPRPKEKVKSANYTFRISAAGSPHAVEVSINKGPWLPCRSAVGYWWFDWAHYNRGKYQAVVRAHNPKGEKVASRPRSIIVDLS